jgi:hypothetical protein
MSELLKATARSWWQDEPERLAREQEAMRAAAPDLAWLPGEPSGGWQGKVPVWPFARPEPAGLARLLNGQALEVQIVCGHAFPMVEPEVWPLSVEVPSRALGWTNWHVAPGGSLCLLQASAQWDPADTTAELVPKISGWHIEYHLMVRGLIQAMTEQGLEADDSLDNLLNDPGPS